MKYLKMELRYMDNLKDNSYYLKKIITDITFIIEKTKGLTQEELEDNEILVDSVMFRLIQISENSNKLTDDFKSCHSTIPWRAIKGMRNKIVHEYGVVVLSVIFDTIKTDLPKLIGQLTEIMEH